MADTVDPWTARLPEALRHDAILLAGLEYWRAARRESLAPDISAIDPLLLPRRVLPCVVLADFVGERIRYRLVGTNMVDQWGEDFTGRFLDEIMAGEYGTYIHDLFRQCATMMAPVFSESTFRWDVGRVVWTRRLMLPFLGAAESRLMVVQTFGGDGAATHPPSRLSVIGGWAPQTPATVLAI